MENKWENQIIGKIFKEQKGQIMERGCLGSISENDYQEEIEKDLYSFFIKKIDSNLDKELKNHLLKKDKDAICSFILEVKKNNPEKLENLKDVSELVKRTMDSKVKKNRHKFLNEIDIEKQFKIIEKSQGNNFEPSEPRTDFIYDLHAIIVDKLGLEDFSDLEYYTAINTHLDNCGVDGFFKLKYRDEEGHQKFIRACFDLTSNTPENKRKQQEEKRGFGAKSLTDITIFLPDDDLEKIKQIYKNRRESALKNDEYSKKTKEDYRLIMNNFANQITNVLLTKKRGNEKK